MQLFLIIGTATTETYFTAVPSAISMETVIIPAGSVPAMLTHSDPSVICNTHKHTCNLFIYLFFKAPHSLRMDTTAGYMHTPGAPPTGPPSSSVQALVAMVAKWVVPQCH